MCVCVCVCACMCVSVCKYIFEKLNLIPRSHRLCKAKQRNKGSKEGLMASQC